MIFLYKIINFYIEFTDSVGQTKHQEATYKPKAEDIPAYIAKPNGQKVEFKLKDLVSVAKRDEDFAKTELTVFITGLPEESNTVRKANQKLIRSYMQRYNGERKFVKSSDYEVERDEERSAERYNSKESRDGRTKTGDLVVIDLAKVLRNFEQYAKLDTTKVGKMIAELLVELTNETSAAKDKIFIVAQGVSAHVAGAAGRQYTAITGHKLRRITALEPSKIFATKYDTLVGLARADADFVDAIHTGTFAMGTPTRCGNADFYVNGPTVAPEGADNVLEAAALATSLFAESLIFGNEHAFPAIRANSLEQYKSHQGMGPRAFMGIACEFDTEGDYILEVNTKSPHARRTPARAQRGYHASHESWRKWNKNNSEEY